MDRWSYFFIFAAGVFAVWYYFLIPWLKAGYSPVHAERRRRQARVSGAPVTDEEREDTLFREFLINQALRTSFIFRLRHGPLKAQRRLSGKPRLRLIENPSIGYNSQGRMPEPSFTTE